MKIGKEIGTQPRKRKARIVKAYRGELLPPSVRKATVDFIEMLERRGLKYLVVGAVPVQFYGRERFSRDVDFVVFLNSNNLSKFFNMLTSGRYKIRYPLPHEHRIDKPEDLLSWHLVRLEDLKQASLLDVHLKPKNLGLDEKSLDKSKIVVLEDKKIVLPSVEDYLITKFLSRRPSSHDFEDIMSTLIRQWNKIDWEYLETKAEKHGVLFLLTYYKESIEKKMGRRESRGKR
jgi:hypothetical protein